MCVARYYFGDGVWLFFVSLLALGESLRAFCAAGILSRRRDALMMGIGLRAYRAENDPPKVTDNILENVSFLSFPLPPHKVTIYKGTILDIQYLLLTFLDCLCVKCEMLVPSMADVRFLHVLYSG